MNLPPGAVQVPESSGLDARIHYRVEVLAPDKVVVFFVPQGVPVARGVSNEDCYYIVWQKAPDMLFRVVGNNFVSPNFRIARALVRVVRGHGLLGQSAVALFKSNW